MTNGTNENNDVCDVSKPSCGYGNWSVSESSAFLSGSSVEQCCLGINNPHLRMVPH